nr:hypothetical protein [Fusobacterium hwasookii]
MKKLLMMLALILGVSAMAEDATNGAMATMKKEAKKVEAKMADVKEEVKEKAEKAGEKLEAAKDKVAKKWQM